MIHLCPKCAEVTPGQWDDDLYWDCVHYKGDVTWAWCEVCRARAKILRCAQDDKVLPQGRAEGLRPPGRGLVLNLIREINERRKCLECGRRFMAHQRNQKYCEEDCKQRAAWKRTKKWREKHRGPPGGRGRRRKDAPVEMRA